MAKGIGKTKTHKDVGASPKIAKSKYEGKEVLNGEKKPVWKGGAYEGKEVHGEKQDTKVTPRKKIDLGAKTSHFIPEGMQGMYK